MTRKKLSIGITVNLENFENLRLEVEGEAGDEAEAEELIAFLDGMLTRLGHGDPVTAERVEAYRKRVISRPAPAGSPPPAPRPVEVEITQAEVILPARKGVPSGIFPPSPVPGPKEGQKEAPVPLKATPSVEGVEPGSRDAQPPAAAGGMATGRAPASRAGPAPVSPEKGAREARGPSEGSTQSGDEARCEGCGTPVTRSQEKLSRLLAGRSLCKRCMNHP